MAGIMMWLAHFCTRGEPDIAVDIRVTTEQEGLNGGPVLRNLLLLCNPDAQSSFRTILPGQPGDSLVMLLRLTLGFEVNC